MKILFAFENPLPSAEADAEVFMTTAKYLAPRVAQSWMHVPAPDRASVAAAAALAGTEVVRAWAPLRPAALRHFCCGITLVLRRAFWRADLIYTRNLWVAWMAITFGQRVVFDHYRPWPDQIPPLQFWIHRLMCGRRFLVNICHSDYTRRKYLELGIPPAKLVRVWNGFEPARLRAPVPLAAAKQAIGVPPAQKTVIYTGRINHKKGLHLVVEAARRLPDLLFILVGSQGDGPIEKAAAGVRNIRIVGWQTPEDLSRYIFGADVLLIPPSSQPLAEYGSTVLPLKLFLYMASGRPILAGDTADVAEVLNEHNALLCRADNVPSLVAGIGWLTVDPTLGARLAARAVADSKSLTWEARAARIADIVASQLQSPRQAGGVWSRAQNRSWLRQSRYWLLYLIRRRSWILPADRAFVAPPAKSD